MLKSISLSHMEPFCNITNMARKRKLKMTKKCIAARRCYRARKRGVPARKKRKKGAGFTDVFERLGINTRVLKNRVRPKKSGSGFKRPRTYARSSSSYPSRSRGSSALGKAFGLKGSGLRKKRRGRGRGRGRGAKGAGFWEDVGHTFEKIGQTALQALPMIATML